MSEGSTPPLPEPIRAALEDLIQYTWDDEQEDFLWCERPGDEPPALTEVTDPVHVFVKLVRLDQWLRGQDWSAAALHALLQTLYTETFARNEESENESPDP